MNATTQQEIVHELARIIQKLLPLAEGEDCYVSEAQAACEEARLAIGELTGMAWADMPPNMPPAEAFLSWASIAIQRSRGREQLDVGMQAVRGAWSAAKVNHNLLALIDANDRAATNREVANA